MTNWMDYCEPPRTRPEGYEWDVFLSYRSLDRRWTIALYDALKQCGYRVFLDQFVLVIGQGLTSQLGDLEQAKILATQVLDHLKEQARARGGEPSPEYWERVTEPEALLLTGEAAGALKRYHEARVAHQHEKGSIESTALQLKRLLAVLPLEDSAKTALAREFHLDQPPG